MSRWQATGACQLGTQEQPVNYNWRLAKTRYRFSASSSHPPPPSAGKYNCTSALVSTRGSFAALNSESGDVETPADDNHSRHLSLRRQINYSLTSAAGVIMQRYPFASGAKSKCTTRDDHAEYKDRSLRPIGIWRNSPSVC